MLGLGEASQRLVRKQPEVALTLFAIRDDGDPAVSDTPRPCERMKTRLRLIARLLMPTNRVKRIRPTFAK